MTAEFIPGVVLAGGRSTRMGTDKAFAVLRGRPMIEHVIARLGPQLAAVAINGDPARYAGLGPTVLPDPVAGQPGPLAGVLAAMIWARALGADRVVTVPVDTPGLPHDLVARLAACPGLVRARSGDRSHPVVALWPVTLAGAVAASLAAGERRVRAVMGGTSEVAFEPSALANVNTPDDLAAHG